MSATPYDENDKEGMRVTVGERQALRLANLVTKGERFLAVYESANPGDINARPLLLAQFRAQAEVALVDLLGHNHPYVLNYKAAASSNGWSDDNDVRRQLGVIQAVIDDINSGHLLRTTETLVAADVFSDFLEQADHLLVMGYHIAAASLAGAVLESDLRRFAAANNISLKDREDISSLNQKCAQAKLYTIVDRKQVEVWAAVRNLADHGDFNALTVGTVTEMLQGVRQFVRQTLRVQQQNSFV